MDANGASAGVPMNRSSSDALDLDTTTCYARRKRGGGRCRRACVPGRNRCSLHGGKSLRGYEHPSFRGKGYSAFVDPALSRILDAVGNVDNFVDMSRELTLVRGHIMENAQGLRDNANPRAWTQLQRDAASLVEAFANNDLPAARALANAIAERTRKAVARHGHWTKIESSLRTLAKIGDLHRKVIDTLSEVMSREKFAAYWGNIVQAVDRAIERDDERRAIAEMLMAFHDAHPYRDSSTRKFIQRFATTHHRNASRYCPTCGRDCECAGTGSFLRDPQDDALRKREHERDKAIFGPDYYG
jgi:hypothetical protein